MAKSAARLPPSVSFPRDADPRAAADMMKGFGCRPMRCGFPAGARPASESLSRRNPRETGAELIRGYGDLVFSGAGRNADGARGGIDLTARRRSEMPRNGSFLRRGVVVLGLFSSIGGRTMFCARMQLSPLKNRLLTICGFILRCGFENGHAALVLNAVDGGARALWACSNISMMIRWPPQQGQGPRLSLAVPPASSCGGSLRSGRGSEVASKRARILARFSARLPLANSP